MYGEKLSFRMRRKLWTLLSDEKSWARHNLTKFRDRERFGIISRPNYLYGMLRAADLAKYCGKECVTVLEFGVASGAGLLNMVELASLIERETGVRLRIVGFDTGKGLPAVEGYKDHPELWNPGDFTNEDKEGLIRRLDGRAEIIWGDIADTIGPFTDAIDQAAPIGFVAIDVDIYSATTQALRCLTQSPEKYTPAVSMYFDDIGMFFANEWCGELAAISEFNAKNQLRKIGIDRSLPGQRPAKTDAWYSQMYVCHVLDHELRQKPQSRHHLSIAEHQDFIGAKHLI
jgi:hypothetical protein